MVPKMFFACGVGRSIGTVAAGFLQLPDLAARLPNGVSVVGVDHSRVREGPARGKRTSHSSQIHDVVLLGGGKRVAAPYNGTINACVKLCHQFVKRRAGEVFCPNRSAQY